MKEVNSMTDERLEQLLSEMRQESGSEAQAAEAKARVWEKLTVAAAGPCAEFQPLLTDYAAGQLEYARRLLVEDHLARCATCRRIYAELKGERTVTAMPAVRAPRKATWTKWAIAAGVAAMAIYGSRDRIDSAFAPSVPRAVVASVNGTLYRVSDGVLHSGATLAEGEAVRTGPGSRAVLTLADGSRVEINERTELAIRAAWSGQSIQLERGDVIVEAAKQRRGYLRVLTGDSTVSVKGTVFAVSSGSAGSLVSVVEGSVAVSQSGAERLLTKGQQVASNQAISGMPVRSAVSWSENAQKYYSLLAELIQIEKQVASTATPAARISSRLVTALPPNPMIYVAAPNLGDSVQYAATLIEQRARESETVREWWASPAGQKVQQLVRNVQSVAPSLGEEVVFVMVKDQAGREHGIPLILAEVRAGQQTTLKQALDALGAEIHYQVTGNMVAVSDSAANVSAMVQQLGRGASSPFAAEIARHYQRGVDFLCAIDIASFPRGQHGGQFVALGSKDMKYLFFEQRTQSGITDNEASLAFAGPRKGIASWLGAPAPAGSSEYVSSDTVAAVSASTRNPRQAFEELLTALDANGSKLAAEFHKFESETGINISNDIASALGTDFTVSLEKPTLPLPMWVAAIEVVNPSLFDSTMRRFVENANRTLATTQPPRQLILAEEVVNGRRWMTLKMSSEQATHYWTYDRGYLVMSTDRATAAQALAVRASGMPLVRSTAFRDQLPGTSAVHYSGFVWLNTKGALVELGPFITNPSLKAAAESREPLLLILNGETEQLRVTSRTRITSLMLGVLLTAGVNHAERL